MNPLDTHSQVKPVENSKTSKGIFGWGILFTLSHFIPFIILLSAIFCRGALGVGITCLIPIEEFAAIGELSMILLLPIWPPIVFWKCVPARYRTSSFIFGLIFLALTFIPPLILQQF